MDVEGNGCVKASFTVEAALLMTILLPTLVALLYMIFYVHDGSVMQGAACEAAAMGSNLILEDDRERILEEKAGGLAAGRFLGTKGTKKTVTVGKNQVSVQYSGSFSVPGLVAGLIAGNELSVQRGWERKVFHPAEEIRKIRGLKDMIDTIRE